MSPITAKTCVVTGGNRGIGLELVRQLAGKGNTVIATARKPTEATELHQLAEGGAKVTVSQLDVTDENSIATFVDEVKQKVEHVDYWINNAGVLKSTGLMSITGDEMMSLFRINTLGPLLLVQQALKAGLLGGKKGGSVVANMTSKMGSLDDLGSGAYYSYRASKCALNIVTATMAIDLQREGITCVLLHPGYVRTGMTGYNGLTDADESAAGLLAVLERGPEISGRWFDFRGNEIPW